MQTQWGWWERLVPSLCVSPTSQSCACGGRAPTPYTDAPTTLTLIVGSLEAHLEERWVMGKENHLYFNCSVFRGFIWQEGEVWNSKIVPSVRVFRVVWLLFHPVFALSFVSPSGLSPVCLWYSLWHWFRHWWVHSHAVLLQWNIWPQTYLWWDAEEYQLFGLGL